MLLRPPLLIHIPIPLFIILLGYETQKKYIVEQRTRLLIKIALIFQYWNRIKNVDVDYYEELAESTGNKDLDRQKIFKLAPRPVRLDFFLLSYFPILAAMCAELVCSMRAWG